VRPATSFPSPINNGRFFLGRRLTRFSRSLGLTASCMSGSRLENQIRLFRESELGSIASALVGFLIGNIWEMRPCAKSTLFRECCCLHRRGPWKSVADSGSVVNRAENCSAFRLVTCRNLLLCRHPMFLPAASFAIRRPCPYFHSCRITGRAPPFQPHKVFARSSDPIRTELQ